MMSGRFVNDALSELQGTNRSPIYGYEDSPIQTLEETMEKIITFIPLAMDYVTTAKRKCNQRSIFLTQDESAAIYLYSMPTSIFSRLNEALRAEDRHALEPWFPFLKLFITALEKLPSRKQTIWRGVSGDVGSIFDDGDMQIWWNVTSCSSDLSVVKKYLVENSTLFIIEASHGKDISSYSTFPEEKEILLMPGTHVRAKCHSFNLEDHFCIVHLDEETSERLACLKYNLSLSTDVPLIEAKV